MEKYSKYFTIPFRDIDEKNKLKFHALVDYMQETSNEHAQKLGVDFNTPYKGKQYYWIVSRSKFYLKRYPKWQETIRVETYPVGIQKLFAVRRFDLWDDKDNSLGYIIGYYILMDLDNQRPARLKTLAQDFELFNAVYEGETLEKLKGPEMVLEEDTRKVRSGEIDSNKHMNNAHYIRWTTDMFTTKALIEAPIESIEINYTTALLEGTTVQIIKGSESKGRYEIQGRSLDEKIIYWTSQVITKE